MPAMVFINIHQLVTGCQGPLTPEALLIAAPGPWRKVCGENYLEKNSILSICSLLLWHALWFVWAVQSGVFQLDG